jgi:hypothetical protein
VADVEAPGGAHAAQDSFFVRGICHSNQFSLSTIKGQRLKPL